MRHDILEVAAIPRDKKQLAAIIGTARYERRRARVMQLAALVCVLVGCIILWGTFA